MEDQSRDMLLWRGGEAACWPSRSIHGCSCQHLEEKLQTTFFAHLSTGLVPNTVMRIAVHKEDWKEALMMLIAGRLAKMKMNRRD